MRESNKSSRSWRVGDLSINFLARLRTKVKRKADAFFVNHFFGEHDNPPPSPPPHHPTHSWTAPHSQFDHNEASGSNPNSTPNSQYFDAVDPSEYATQHQLPRFEFANLQVRSTQPHGISGHQGFEMYNAGQPLDGTLMDLHLERPPSHDQGFLRDFDHQFHQYSFGVPGEISEFSDTVTEMQRDAPLSSWQGHIDYSQGREAPSMSMQMSGDTMETVDSNTMDTGESSYILPPHPEQQRDFKQYVQRLRHILLGEELRLPRKRGFRVVASIVYVFRKLRGIVQRKQMQRTGPRTTVSGELEGSSFCKMKRIRSAECSKVYQGIKRRRGKWVTEIRFSKLRDCKVWLGSFPTEKKAALAYDAGLHHCNLKRTKIFNFKESPMKLGPSQYLSLYAMSKEDRKAKVQSLADDHAMAYGSSNNIR